LALLKRYSLRFGTLEYSCGSVLALRWEIVTILDDIGGKNLLIGYDIRYDIAYDIQA